MGHLICCIPDSLKQHINSALYNLLNRRSNKQEERIRLIVKIYQVILNQYKNDIRSNSESWPQCSAIMGHLQTEDYCQQCSNVICPLGWQTTCHNPRQHHFQFSWIMPLIVLSFRVSGYCRIIAVVHYLEAQKPAPIC